MAFGFSNFRLFSYETTKYVEESLEIYKNVLTMMSFELVAFREHKSDNDISESAVMDVQRNFNEGSSYEKQLMSILYFAPFTVEFDRRLDIFYSLLDEGLIVGSIQIYSNSISRTETYSKSSWSRWTL